SHLADIKENLADLSQVGKKINTEDIKKKLGELGKEFSQELKNDLSSLNNLADNLQEVKNNLKSLGEISLQLKGLSNLEGIKNNLNNLKGIKNDISKLKLPGGSKELEAIKEKLAGLEKEGQELINEFSEVKNSTICQKCNKQKIVSSSSSIGAYLLNDLSLKEET